MLSEQEAIDHVNPFVTHDFSLPGTVRQTGPFEDYKAPLQNKSAFEDEKKSVYCGFGLCEDETKINDTFSTIHPKRNIDSGDCIERQAPFISSEAMNVENNLSNVSLLGYTLCAAIILYLVILRVKR
jgi:hypothetical protein